MRCLIGGDMYDIRSKYHNHGGAAGRAAPALWLVLLIVGSSTIIMAATPNLGESISPALEEFVFHPDQFKTEDIPRGLVPELIAKYTQVRIGPLTPLGPVKQVEKVVNWYDVLEVCEHLAKLLDKREPSAEALQRSAVICRILARLGDASQHELAWQYATTHLAERAETIPVLTELVSVHEALGGEENPLALRQRIDARLARASASAATDAQARQEQQALERLKNVALPQAQQVNVIKLRILRMASRPERLAEEARVYLGLKYGYGEYLPAWAASRLRRECWAEQPDQQTERKIDPARRLEVIAALRGNLPVIAGVPKITDPEKDFMRVTALKAVQSFGGQLSDDELMFVAEKGESIKTILSL